MKLSSLSFFDKLDNFAITGLDGPDTQSIFPGGRNPSSGAGRPRRAPRHRARRAGADTPGLTREEHPDGRASRGRQDRPPRSYARRCRSDRDPDRPDRSARIPVSSCTPCAPTTTGAPSTLSQSAGKGVRGACTSCPCRLRRQPESQIRRHRGRHRLRARARIGG